MKAKKETKRKTQQKTVLPCTDSRQTDRDRQIRQIDRFSGRISGSTGCVAKEGLELLILQPAFSKAGIIGVCYHTYQENKS